jgi:MoaA/NifB/PqqE/SkfB family radical SAM enzyme
MTTEIAPAPIAAITSVATPTAPAAADDHYGFHDRLTAAFPSQVIIDTTELCNLACIHCQHPLFKQSEYYAGRSLDKELNAKAVDEVREHGQGKTQYIRYTGEGEPMLHRHVFEMLSYAVKHSGVTVTLTTNGALLTPERVEKLIASGVDVVDISIDALNPETYARIRVRGDLEVTRANVLNLLRASKEPGSRTKVVVSYIEQPQNVSETDEFERFWRGNGADYVVVRRLHSNAGANLALAEQMRERNAGMARRPCLYPWERVVLNPRGHLSFCPADWTSGSKVADYRTTTIAETWQGEFYDALRKAHLTNNFKRHPFCGQCPDWSATRWPHEGRSYANMVQEFKETE